MPQDGPPIVDVALSTRYSQRKYLRDDHDEIPTESYVSLEIVGSSRQRLSSGRTFIYGITF